MESQGKSALGTRLADGRAGSGLAGGVRSRDYQISRMGRFTFPLFSVGALCALEVHYYYCMNCMCIHVITVIAWDQARRWGKKEKKLGERSEPRGNLGRGKVVTMNRKLNTRALASTYYAY